MVEQYTHEPYLGTIIYDLWQRGPPDLYDPFWVTPKTNCYTPIIMLHTGYKRNRTGLLFILKHIVFVWRWSTHYHRGLISLDLALWSTGRWWPSTDADLSLFTCNKDTEEWKGHQTREIKYLWVSCNNGKQVFRTIKVISGMLAIQKRD